MFILFTASQVYKTELSETLEWLTTPIKFEYVDEEVTVKEVFESARSYFITTAKHYENRFRDAEYEVWKSDLKPVAWMLYDDLLPIREYFEHVPCMRQVELFEFNRWYCPAPYIYEQYSFVNYVHSLLVADEKLTSPPPQLSLAWWRLPYSS